MERLDAWRVARAIGNATLITGAIVAPTFSIAESANNQCSIKIEVSNTEAPSVKPNILESGIDCNNPITYNPRENSISPVEKVGLPDLPGLALEALVAVFILGIAYELIPYDIQSAIKKRLTR